VNRSSWLAGIAEPHDTKRSLTALPAAATQEYQRRRYAVLRSGSRVLAVYRIKPNGGLRRLHYWPDVLNEI
jgi:hypothetical protein